MFKKAKPEQGFLKMSMYGPPGSGKTFTTLLMAEGLANGKRIAYVDTERGTDFYAKEVKERKPHPEAFDFDTIYTRSLKEVIDEIQTLDPKEYSVIVIDSISHMWDAAIAAYEGKMTKADTIPMQAWGKIKKPYKQALVQWLMDSPFHVFILGRQKNIFETKDGEFSKVGVGMRAEGETEFEPHICARMEAKKNTKDPSRSTVFAYFEKDRTSVLSGRTYPNPDFNTLLPVLPLLEGEQAKSEDPDEVAAKDSELLDKEEQKKKGKEDKSETLLAEITAEIQAAPDMDHLNAIATKIKKEKRYLLEDHLNSIRILYKKRHDKLSNEHAPTEV